MADTAADSPQYGTLLQLPNPLSAESGPQPQLQHCCSAMFKELEHSNWSSLLISSAYHKNTLEQENVGTAMAQQEHKEALDPC